MKANRRARSLILERSVPEPNTGCHLWTGTVAKQGYGVVTVRGRQYRAHRLSYMLFRGFVPETKVVRHRCDQPTCVNPEHLEVGSHQDNMRDRNARGRQVRGERCHAARLTERQVVQIRRLNASGFGSTELAEMFGVGRTTVDKVVALKSWRHVVDGTEGER